MSNRKTLDYALLEQLTQEFGPSGNEQAVADLITKQVNTIADSVQADPLGNLIVRKKGNGKRIMIACHMDEVGVMVTHIDDRGYLYFVPVGGLKSLELAGKRVRFANGRFGIISGASQKKEENPSTLKCFIDIGVSSEEEARSIVTEGDMAVLVGDFQENNNHLLSKALDNRAGCFLAIEVLKQLQSENDLFFTFTAQEEVGARGAKAAALTIQPDLALVIDTTISYDSAEDRNRTSLGHGAAIKVMDRSIVVSPQIKNWMAEIAGQKDISFQWEIITAGGTDSGPIHLTQGGIPTGGLAIPTRYLHTGNEMVAKTDLQSAYHLLMELLQNPYNGSYL